jgi:DNA-binding GntR family transcriptional regulator
MGTSKKVSAAAVKQSKPKAGASAAVRKGGSLAPTPQQTESVDYTAIENIHKSGLTPIAVSQLPKEKPDFQAPGVTKDGLIAEWLMAFVEEGLKKGTLTENHLFPKKADIADYLGVSVGTVQNAIRYIEDQGYVVSKQRIGTIVSNPAKQATNGNRVRKLTSKRDVAVIAIKQLIVQRSVAVGDALPSAREVAKLIGSAPNTTRLALEYLASIGIVDDRGNRGNKANWYLKVVPELTDASVTEIASETLIDQIETDLKRLIAEQFQVGDKLPSHLELADALKVSIKTIHDAMSRITKQGIVQSLRGRYGTYVLRIPDLSLDADIASGALEAPPAFFTESLQYNYKKVEQHLSQYIATQFQVGDKLPSMSQLAQVLDVSSNTIRHAMQNLSQEGYLRFERGRYGGTFVLALPKTSKKAGKGAVEWVSKAGEAGGVETPYKRTAANSN